MEDPNNKPVVPGLNSVSIDELIDAVEDTENTIQLHPEIQNSKHTDVRNYIRATGMVAKNVGIPAHAVYDHYCAWSPNPVGPIIFYRYLKQYFEYKKLLGVWCFRINPESVGMPSYYTIYKDRRYSDTAKQTSKYRGVYCVYGYWIARLKLEDNLVYIGRYQTDKEAAEAYDQEAFYHFGELAKLNFKSRMSIYEEEVKRRQRKTDWHKKGKEDKAEVQGEGEETPQVPETKVSSS